jgi:hypothetical protein
VRRSKWKKTIGNNLFNVDFYLEDLDMVIDVYGPAHYRNGTKEIMDSSLYIDRIVKKYHKHYLVIDYALYNTLI